MATGLWLDVVVGQSTEIRRVFLADVAICAPYMSREEEKMFLARLVQVKGKADFERMLADLRVIAERNNTKLLDVSLW